MKIQLSLLCFCLVHFLFAQTPTITSFTPIQGEVGDEITITGTNFSTTSSENIVYFGATKAVVTSASETSLKVNVPFGALYAPISVVVNSQIAYSLLPFSVTFSDISTIGSPTTISVGNKPIHLKTGDFDNDGLTDVVVVNNGSNTISVLRNTGNSFTKTDFTTGATPTYVAVGDLTGDAKLDIAVANQNESSVSIFKNNSTLGSIAFSTKVDFGSGTSPRGVEIGDIDGDGLADVIVTNQNGRSISVLRNTTVNESISFATKVDLTNLGLSPQASVLGDFNNDGIVDIATSAKGDNKVIIIPNQSSVGSLSFGGLASLTTASAPQNISAADFNQDGLIDIIVPNKDSSTISVFLNDNETAGTIKFAAKFDKNTGTGSKPFNVAVGDINGDGKVDAIAANNGNNSISVVSNTTDSGTLSFADYVGYDLGTGTAPKGVTTGDLNADGKLDIIVANTNAASISILYNSGIETDILDFSFPEQIGASLIDNNLKTVTIEVPFETDVTDLIAAFELSTGATAQISGVDQESEVTSNNFTNAITYDITAEDGNTIASWMITVTKTAALTDTDILSYSLAEQYYDSSVATIDNVNHEIHIDVAYSQDMTDMLASFTISNFASIKVGTTAQVSGITTNDFTNGLTYTVTAQDGVTSQDWEVIIDLKKPVINSIITSAAPNETVTITGNYFNPNAVENLVFFSGMKAAVVSASKTEITVTVPETALYGPILVKSYDMYAISLAYFAIEYADIGGGFMDKASVSTSESAKPKTIALGDLDNDGFLDIVIGSQISATAYRMEVLRNQGVSGFTSAYNISTSFSPQEVKIVDLNNDGLLDIVIVNSQSETFTIYKNTSTGEGNIAFASKYAVANSSGNYGIGVMDVDGDGRLDILTATQTADQFKYTKNLSVNGNLVFDSTSHDIGALTDAYRMAVGDLDLDGTLDFVGIGETGNVIKAFRNTSANGVVSFSESSEYTTGTNTTAIALADFDGDGKLDVATSNSDDDSVSVLLNTSSVGTVNFAAKQDFGSGDSPIDLKTTDVNGDSKMDILVLNNLDETISVLLNTSTGPANINFAAKNDYSVGDSPSTIATGDIDQDNLPDVIVANSSSIPKISIFNNVIPSTLTIENQFKEDYFFVKTVASNVLEMQLTNDCFGELSLSIYTIQGALLKKVKDVKTSKKFSSHLNIAGLTTGAYLILVECESKVNVAKFIKK